MKSSSAIALPSPLVKHAETADEGKGETSLCSHLAYDMIFHLCIYLYWELYNILCCNAMYREVRADPASSGIL